ncbi:MAG: energy-coupling factor transporter transmembrane protein EcfT [Clostridiales bacterium]|nr:energy-coupling factor transporter transmembrane protein EcfT [Clostridiales bacterium]
MSKVKVDPRVRLLLAVSLTTLAALFNSLTSLGLLLAATVLLCLVFGWAGMSLLRRAKWLLGFFVLMAILQSVFNPSGNAIFAVNGAAVLSTGGVLLGACFLCRMMVIVFSAGILAAAGSRAMIQSLVALKLPYELAFMTTCALSFIPMIGADMKDSVTALQLRGVELGKLPWASRLSVYGYLVIPVLEGIVIKARELSCAMEMRAFRAYSKRTSYTVLSLTARDYVIMALTLAAFVLGLFLYFT